MATSYSDIFSQNQVVLKDVVRKSKTWFQQQSLLLTKQRIAPQRLIASDPDLNVTKIIPGELYLFMYDAKMHDTLPYWDMFPLVFPFRKLNNGFIGLNMHYLPYQARVQLLDRLMVFKTSARYTQAARLKYSWDTISAMSKFRLARPCVHKYLMSQVQSPFKRIGIDDWATAMMLPVERFVGSSKQQVWTESMR